MKYIQTVASLVVILIGYVLSRKAKEQEQMAVTDDPKALRKLKTNKRMGLIVTILGGWFLVGSVLTLIFGAPASEVFSISIFPKRVDFAIFGYRPSETMMVGFGVTAAVIVITILLRVFFIPRLSDEPGKFQNVVEMIVEYVESYSSERTVDLGRPMFGYIFAIGVTLIGNAVAELMGFRSPSSDLTFTLALAFFAFFMANWYGIRHRSLKGRVKSLLSPTPLLLPIRLVTDLANPLSMACRLFGNTISGMIVMNLIYSVLGNFASGIPSVVGLYFNVFTALIQTIIFVTLTLSIINETTVEPEV